LQDQGDEIKAAYKSTLNGNVIPPMDNPDDASEDRFVVIPMLTQYSHNAPKDVAEQWRQSHFPVDKDFIDKVSNYSTAFLWVMVSYFNKYMTEGLVKTELINKYTMEYWKENNLFNTFLKMCVNYVGRTPDGKLIETPENALNAKNKEKMGTLSSNSANAALIAKYGNLPKIPTMKLFTTFSGWYKLYFPGAQKAPNIKSFISNVSRIIGPPIGNIWPGLVLVKGDNGSKGQEQVIPSNSGAASNENNGAAANGANGANGGGNNNRSGPIIAGGMPAFGMSKINAIKNMKKDVPPPPAIDVASGGGEPDVIGSVVDVNTGRRSSQRLSAKRS
jgi:hypothetical protein